MNVYKKGIIILILAGLLSVAIGTGIRMFIQNRKTDVENNTTNSTPKIEYSVREMTNAEYLEIGEQALQGSTGDLNDNQKRTLKRSAIYEAIYNNEAVGYMNTLKVTDIEKREYINTHDLKILKVKVDDKGRTLDYLMEGSEPEQDVTYRDVTDEDYLNYAEMEIVAELIVQYVSNKTDEVLNDTNR